MASGPKRHRLLIQQDQGTSQASNGEHIESWVTLATVWGEGGPLQGRELWAAQQAQSEVTHRFKIRYGDDLNDLSGNVRLILRDRVLHVLAALNLDERNKEIRLDCKESPDQRRVILDPDGSPIFDPDGNLIQEP